MRRAAFSRILSRRTQNGSGSEFLSYIVGAFWAGMNALASVLLPFALFVFFAREIRPATLGLVAFAMACTEVCKAIGLPGIYEALLQQKDDIRRCHETAIALLLCASSILMPVCLLVLYGLGFLVHGLHERFLVLGVLVLRIPLDLATVQPQAMLVGRLDFRRLAIRTVVANCLAGSIGVLIATVAEPVAGLVAYQLGQSLITFAGTSLGAGLLARPRLHADCIGRLRRETLLSTGNRTLAATINYLDQMVVGPVAGELGLAYYNLGKRLETMFVTVANSFSAILFQPLFAANSTLSKQKGTIRALLVLAVVCGIPSAVVFSNSKMVVGLIFGRNWIGAAPIVGWLSLNGFVRAVGMVPGSFLSVSGRNRELLVTSVASAAGSLALVAALASSNLVACAIGLVVKNAAIVGWMAWLCRHEVPHPGSIYATTSVLPVAVMIAAASTVTSLLPPGFAPGRFHELSSLVCSGLGASCCGGAWIGIAYLLSVRSTARRPAMELRA